MLYHLRTLLCLAHFMYNSGLSDDTLMTTDYNVKENMRNPQKKMLGGSDTTITPCIMSIMIIII